MGALLVLVGDDAAGVAARSLCGSDFEVHEEAALTRVAELYLLVVFDGVLVSVGSDAPDVQGEDLRVFIEGDGDSALVAALGTKDFDDAAEVLGGAAVGRDGVGGVFEEDYRVGVGRILRQLLLCGGTDPVGNVVGPGGERWDRAEEDKTSD